jgi:AcrR family transcriptional regulator
MRSDARANRERLLAAAEEVFGEAGADGSTEEVARRAGVGIGTVFRHFPTKRDLVEATVVRHFEQLTGQARELAAAPDATAALHKLIETMVSGGATKITLVSLLFDGGGDADAAVGAAERLREVFGGLLRRAQQAGAVRRDVSVDEVYLLIRALSQASGTKATRRKALAVVLDGLATPAAGR